MNNSRLTKYPTTKDLLVHIPESGEALRAWGSNFSAATEREYLEGWFTWYMENREQLHSVNSDKSLARIFRQYGQICGKESPWFTKSIRIVQDSDPEALKPIMASYFSAKLETLSSLNAFQIVFKKGGGFSTEQLTRHWLNMKISGAAEEKPALPFLFPALANGYEHTFSFLIRMLGQFTQTYNRAPDLQEFDRLTRQLAFELHRETRMSREANTILEMHFNDVDPFFSFEERDGIIKLSINHPSPEETAEIVKKFDQPEMACERRNLDLRSLRPGHYGCPAAFSQHQGKNLTGFVFDEVIGSVRRALWPPESFNMAPVVPIEKAYRTVGLG